MEKSIYSLTEITHLPQNNFYTVLSDYTDFFLSQPDAAGMEQLVKDFQKYIFENNIERVRSSNEYLIELLILGVFWEKYGKYSSQSGFVLPFTLKKLYDLRTYAPKIKPQVDKIRGWLTAFLVVEKNDINSNNLNLRNVHKLLLWLDASGDFKEEVKRLKTWLRYFNAKPDQFRKYSLRLINLSRVFEYTAQQKLGIYTRRVKSFIIENKKDYKYKENYIFASRSEVEYHLNMLCAEIMNRAFKKEYSKTEKKVVLLPTCMRPIDKAINCNAKKDGDVFKCSKCNLNCNVYKVANEIESENSEIVLIKHSSSFTKLLKNWQNSKTVGLLGVACVLNLIRGGYEMRNLNIPAQCVFLNYSGCPKHWKAVSRSTEINTSQLKVVLNKNSAVQNNQSFDKLFSVS